MIIILKLLSGVAMFLYGMSLMGDGLKKAAGNKLQAILYKLTSSTPKGILLGAGVTAVIQSSSATTVMVVGFVNSGMMKVRQAIGIIMGANIGTSITGWVLCLSYIEGTGGIASLLSTATISAVVAIVGIIFRMFSKKTVLRNLGDIMLGFAILMTGMQSMSSAVSPLRSNPTFVKALTMFTNPLMGILIGVAFTAVLQSASASIGILQALSLTGSITFASALPIIMGIGVGAACPVLLSSIGTSKNGKRTALIYLMNDLFGMVFWGIVFYSVHALVHFGFMGVVMSPVLIAALNTCYRTLNICVLSPFTGYMEKIVYAVIRDSKEDIEDRKDFSLLEERFLQYPDIAVAQSGQALYGMGKKVKKNISRSLKLLRKYSEKNYKKVQSKEDLIDEYEDKIGSYLLKVTQRNLSKEQSKVISLLLHGVNDFERMGDQAAKIADYASKMEEEKLDFSDAAKNELRVLIDALKEVLRMTNDSFTEGDLEKAAQIEPLRDWIGLICAELRGRHASRLQSGNCHVETGFVFNDLLTSVERIVAHCSNIALITLEMNTPDFDRRRYIRELRDEGNTVYRDAMIKYKNMFVIPDEESAGIMPVDIVDDDEDEE